jgi:acyl-CoA thioesterase
MSPVDQPAMSPQAIAERVGAGMFAEDAASPGLGMRIDAIGPGRARMCMSVRADMLNGFKVCHGGFIATLADSAFAFACNSYNELTVASGFSVDLVAPAYEGDLLTADAVEVMRRGRTGVYDVRVTNQRDELIAVFRGRSHAVKGKQVVAL